jgi:hypothetical protein
MQLEMWQPASLIAVNRRFMLHSNVTFYSRLINFARALYIAFTLMLVWFAASRLFVRFHADCFFADDYVGFLFFPFKINNEHD